MKTTRSDTISSQVRPGINHVDIASHNSRSALELLRRFGPMTRQELSAQLNLTEPAITGIMKRLISAGHVQQRKRTGSGRYMSNEFTLIPDSAYALGISLAGTENEILLSNLAGQIVCHEYFSQGEQAGCIISNMLSGHAVAERLAGIGIASPPGRDQERNSLLETLTELPCQVIEDTEASLVAERLLGVGNKEGGIVVILINETVRAGLLIGGKPFRGEHGLAGQIGAMRTGNDRAPLDQTITRPALDACKRTYGDLALDIWAENAGQHLIDAVTAIGGFLSPGLILIGGDIPRQTLDHMIEAIRNARMATVGRFRATSIIPEVQPTSFPNGGVALGAAMSIFTGKMLPELSVLGG